ncbi:major facilitator superfamily domain-containing protein [Infundibulicybe gibba]|nr:major facilitator superfamily domain-containing protein [Infundibulicybe gibba]
MEESKLKSEVPSIRLQTKSTSSTTKLYQPEVDTSGVNERKLMRKIDLHLIPWLTILYLLNFLDRGSVGNAKLYSLETDIHITDKQYLIALTVFFFPYALFEPISNVVLRRLRPSIWLSTMILLWGITLHGVIKNYGGLVTLRVLLGLAEAGMYPGIVFYISSWYKRSELGTRVAIFFSSATIAGAFSGLLAAAIANMDGIGGKHGISTVVASVISYWIIQDFPDSAKFLTLEERVFVIRRLQEDMMFSAGGEAFKMRYIWQSLCDWKTWLSSDDGPLYAFSLFLPTIIKQLGFTATTANLLSVPVYAWGCLVTCAIGFLGDRIGTRYHINLYVCITCIFIRIVAYIILIASKTPGLSYFAVYLAVCAWVASNVEGSYKRSVTLGMAIGFGNINGAVTANIYRANTAPWFRLGHSIVLVYILIGFLCSIAFVILLKRENARRDRGDRDEVIEGIENKRAHERNGRYPSVDAARIDKGDRWSGFRYSL